MKNLTKTALFLSCTLILMISGCNKKQENDVLSGKTFSATGQMGEKETYSFKKGGIAEYTMELNGTEDSKEVRLETWYTYHINEETEEIVLQVTKYPYLDENENYTSLTLDELIEKDPEGEADYKKIFDKTLSYKYLLMPSKLVMQNRDWTLEK